MKRAVALAIALVIALAPGVGRADEEFERDAAAMRRGLEVKKGADEKPLLGGYLALENARRAAVDDRDRFYLTQFMGNFLTFVGDYARATAEFPIINWHDIAEVRSPLERGYRAADAIDTIARAARGHRAVFLNEAHTQPLTRTLTIRLLERLRREGFTHLALESTREPAAALNARGYPLESGGPYLREPLYGDLVREALRLGYVVVPYEFESDSQDARESGQARNLHERVFGASPRARVIVHAGYAHVWESGELFGAKTIAQHFKRISGIDPLTIDETVFFERGRREDEHPIYDALARQAGSDAVAFVDSRGRAWSAMPSRYDITVVFPRATLERGRPTWLALGGARRAVPTSAADCAGATPCLVEARYANETDDATPADRVLMVDDDSSTSLYLRPGAYRIASVAPDGTRTARREVRLETKP